MDITLLNVDKNNKIIRTNHKSIENQINHFINTWKKTKIYQTKTFTATIVQENHSLITIIPLDNNHLTEITIAEDLQIEEFQKISHKIDIVDQTVKLISNYSNYNRNQSHSNYKTRYYSNDRSTNSSYNRIRNYSNNRNRQYPDNRSRN